MEGATRKGGMGVITDMHHKARGWLTTEQTYIYHEDQVKRATRQGKGESIIHCTMAVN